MRRFTLFSTITFIVLAALLAHAQAPVEKLEVAYPGKTWSVVVNSPGFVVKNSGTQPNGREYLFAANDATGVNVSVTLERATGTADAGTCSQYLHTRIDDLNKLGITDVKYSTMVGMAAGEYIVPEWKGQKVQQKNVIICTAKEDVYVDIHLSKVQFKPEDEQLFAPVINSISIADTGRSSAAGSNSAKVMELMASGSRFYLQHRYREAIGPYQQALDLEKKQRTLDKNLWHVLVDNLGIAYGITGDLPKAQATLEYGLSEDPTYPMFSYNMACVYADRGDLDKTLELLKTAFSHKENVLPGESMPDPQSDESFQRFRDEPKFRALIGSIGK